MEKTLEEELIKVGKKIPILRTERLILRPFTPYDVKDVFEYACEEEVALYTTFQAHKSLEDSYFFLLHVALPSYKQGDIGPYALEYQGKVIGAVELRKLSSPMRFHVRELGIVLNRKFWRKGFIQEATRKIISYAFKDPHIYRILATIEVDNKNSIKTVQKLGFLYEGCERQGRSLKGRYADMVHYSLLRTEWEG